MVIVDSVGILMGLYQYAHVAYIGGSFRQGVHNVLEAAAYGVPLLVGPKHGNSQEAIELVREGAAFVGSDSGEILHHLHILLHDEERRKRAGQKAVEFVNHHTGATKRFLSYLEKVL